MLKIVKKDDGYWLVIETEGKQAMINLGFPEGIVGDVLKEVSQQKRLTATVNVFIGWRRFLSWLLNSLSMKK